VGYPEVCEYLEWDSKFFGKRIARVTVPRLDEALSKKIDGWCSEKGIDCLYFLADSAALETLTVAQHGGFRFVDARLTLECDHNRVAKNEPPHAGLRRAEESDIPALREVARTAHRDSRFYYDGHFPAKKCGELYETWIEKSCRGWADRVFVADGAETVAGYVTCHIKDGKTGQIGLVGVSEKARGKGLGTNLVLEAVHWFVQEGMQKIRVVTQGRNVGAQRLYQKCGFEPSLSEIWFHRWFLEEERSR
jgi:dTDP-4-amino-4,6-dideoxy-D-galactose acyltransferase